MNEDELRQDNCRRAVEFVLSSDGAFRASRPTEMGYGISVEIGGLTVLEVVGYRREEAGADVDSYAAELAGLSVAGALATSLSSRM